MRGLGGALLVTLALSFASDLASAESATEKVDVAAFTSPTTAPLTRLALGVGAIGAVGWGLTVWSRRRHGASGGEQTRIQVLATRSVGPRHQVALIAVGEHRLLVGMGGDSITSLADLTTEISFSEEMARNMRPQPEEGKSGLLDVIGHFEGLDG